MSKVVTKITKVVDLPVWPKDEELTPIFENCFTSGEFLRCVKEQTLGILESRQKHDSSFEVRKKMCSIAKQFDEFHFHNKTRPDVMILQDEDRVH
eukprot:Pgem_evm1s4810